MTVPPGYMPPNMDPDQGDWACKYCGNWNWARRVRCNKCDAARPEPGWSAGGGTTSIGGSSSSRINIPHEDFGYIVPKHVALAPGAEGRTYAIQAMAGWEKKPKGTAGSSDRRTGNAGGFMEYDRDEEDYRRKQQKEAEKHLVQARKATKQKCAFCHRATCIC